MISAQTTGFFDDVTLRTVITPHLAVSLRELENIDHLLIEGKHSLFDKYPTNIRSSHSQDVDFVENAVIIGTDLSKKSLSTKMATKKASAEGLLRAVQQGRTRTIRER
ncbi:unnamed protein product [Hymenolepis diminuta]|uniref:Uncharacterized protein n=1 Tax=Hymenolepis diminuta TaxID=6216 RepID=A0A564YQ21_HYMDI|nr:unnamed protein product [Hymenolepis diminuta]